VTDTEPRWHTEDYDPERDDPPAEHHAQPEQDPPDLEPVADDG
jgi:hypothetical protein